MDPGLDRATDAVAVLRQTGGLPNGGMVPPEASFIAPLATVRVAVAVKQEEDDDRVATSEQPERGSE